MNDCGIIATCVLISNAMSDKLVKYEYVAEMLTRAYIYNDQGCRTDKLMDFIRKSLSPNSRKRYQAGMSLKDFLAKHQNWTGMLALKGGNGPHGIAVIDGVLYNAEGYEDSRVTFSLAVK